MSSLLLHNAAKAAKAAPGRAANLDQLIRTLGSFKPQPSSDVQYYNFLREFCIIHNCSLEQGIEQAGLAWQQLGRPQQDSYQSEPHACLPIPVPLHLVYAALRDERAGRLSLCRIDRGKTGRYVIASYNAEQHRKCRERRLAEQKLLARFRPQLNITNNSNNNNNHISNEIDSKQHTLPWSARRQLSWLPDTSLKGRPPKLRRVHKRQKDCGSAAAPKPAGAATARRQQRPRGATAAKSVAAAAVAAEVAADVASFARRMFGRCMHVGNNYNNTSNNTSNSNKPKHKCVTKKTPKKQLSNNTNGQRVRAALPDRAIGSGPEQRQRQRQQQQKQKKSQRPAAKKPPQMPTHKKRRLLQ